MNPILRRLEHSVLDDPQNGFQDCQASLCMARYDTTAARADDYPNAL
jgi:hypothetical protein